MKGFIGGSLALIAFYALVQGGSAGSVDAGWGWVNGLARRLISPEVAGIPRVGGAGPGRGGAFVTPPPANQPGPGQPSRPSSDLPANAPVYV